jgi:three-Cys-motif partner protein
VDSSLFAEVAARLHRSLHFYFFSGPGCDVAGTYGSQLRILDQLRTLQKKRLERWGKSKIVIQFFEENKSKSSLLAETILLAEWQIPGVEFDCRPFEFKEALKEHSAILANARIAKFLITD